MSARREAFLLFRRCLRGIKSDCMNTTRLTRRNFLTVAGTAATGAALTANGTVAVGASPVVNVRMPPPAVEGIDVLVVGGGPAGIGAALGAARTGARTLLIENHSFFGGVAAWAMGMQMNQMRPNGKPRSQIHELVIEKLRAYGDQAVRLGTHEVTEEDALAGRVFPDSVAWRSGLLDLGGQRGTKLVRMKIHDVPYRSIVAEKLDGLLVGGRCISATHAGAAAGKSMGNCMATGHAAGLAATLCAKQNCATRELDVARLQAALRADGVDPNPKEREQGAL
jgi:hypothetical protein